MRRILVAIALGSAMLVAGCSGTQGDSMPFDFSYETDSGTNSSAKIGSDPVITYGNISFSGTGTLATAPVDVALQANVLFTDGTGPSGGYLTVTDAAGDELLLQLVSQATAKGSGAVVEGDFTVVTGTGHWAGVTGKGNGVGERGEALGAPVTWHVDLTLE
ncbi:MAG: hypothetical protein F2840_03745 [Actinobacteria bacterium]|uniref:Unannotated protein n=1 Tax=freshwater metagenome TaxID=449393 RepID=A0A6J7J5Z2_9ZZZZ|nr:hypothetical protein [Actinomycetota bacterium]